VVCDTDPAAIARAMRHVADLVGVEHVALGTDFDGTVKPPFDATGLPQLTEALLDAGFSASDIRQIMGANAVRFLRQSLPGGTQRMNE
jgi:microsomal dipeptidase-like Zn-dependent dipeptidase